MRYPYLTSGLTIFWIGLYLTAILAAPALWGANRGWSVGLMAMAMALCLSALALSHPSWLSLTRDAPLRRLTVPLILGLAVFLIAYAGLWIGQPMPTDIVGNVDRLPIHFAPDSYRVKEALLGYIAACLSFLIGYLIIANRPRLARYFLYAGLSAWVAYAIYGILTDCLMNSGPIAVYAQQYNASCSGISGPFRNHNGFATLIGMALVVVCTLFIDSISVLQIDSRRWSSKQQLAGLLRVSIGVKALQLGAIVVLATTLVLTQSRAGTTAAVLALCMIGVLSTKSRSIGWRQFTLAIFALSTSVVVVWLAAGGNLTARMDAHGVFDERRWQLYQATWQMIWERPLTGHGFGNFQETIQQYRTWDMGPYPDWDKAHNSYLEIAAGIGIPGALLFFGMFIWLLKVCWRGLNQNKVRAIYPVIGIGCTCLISLHSLLDFSMQIPAVSMSYAFLLGICIARTVKPVEKRQYIHPIDLN